MYISWAFFCLLGLIAVLLFRLLAKQWHLARVMPPGPPSLPILGHILQLPQSPWLRFTEWKKQHGAIFSLYLLGQPVVVINDIPSAVELLDRQSKISSDRPQFIMVNEVLTQNLSFSAMKYGDRWRRMRRAAHEGFSSRNAVVYQDSQEKESARLLLRLVHNTHNWAEDVRHSIGTLVLNAVYDWQPSDPRTDSLIERIDQFMERILKAAMPGTHLVEVFPWMLHIPESFAKWKRKGLEWYRKDTEMFEGLLGAVASEMKKGYSSPCFSARLLKDQQKYDISNLETAWLAGIIFGAAVDTTSATLSSFLFAMVLHPETVHHAHAELDGVVGRERLPTFADREKLPYIEAIIKEVMRWRPPTPLGVPRSTSEDIWHRGYFIPKGTLILLNVWAINHDPDYFPDHEVFRPERYLDSSGNLTDAIPDTHGLGHMTFGTGRRMCVGKDFATQVLFIFIARLLWAFNFEKAKDADGNPITPSSTDFTAEALIAQPAPFACSITPRSSGILDIIHTLAEGTVG